MARESSYVALLRGINVGKSARIQMAPLRAALIDHGVNAVSTVVQSGNIVVTPWTKSASALATSIEEILVNQFAITARCLVQSREQLLSMVAENPLAPRANVDNMLVVHFCDPPLEQSALSVLSIKGLDPNDVVVSHGALFQWCENGISNSPVVSPHLERQLKVAVTARNWRTLNKIAELLNVE